MKVRLRTALLVAWIAGLPVSAQAPDPRALLERAREAAGGSSLAGIETMVSQLEIAAGGLSGSGEVLEDVRGCRYAGSFDLGAVHGAAGFDGAKAWTRDTNGRVQAIEDAEGKRSAANDAFLRCLGQFFPDRWPAEVRYDREHAEGVHRFHVLEITPRDGRPFELWLDADTLLLDRTVDVTPLETRTTFFYDYRVVGGIKLAHGQRSTTGDSRFDQTTRLLSVELNGEIDPARYELPSFVLADFSIAGGRPSTVVPFELLNHHLYVEIRLNGKGPFRVLVDPGGANLLTPAAAEAAGIAVQAGADGGPSVTEAGTVILGEATIDHQTFFVLPLDGLTAVEGEPFAGLIGWELFKRFVVGIDYSARRLKLTRVEEFRYTGPAKPIPFELDGYSPQVEGKIAGHPARLTLDIGSRNALTLAPSFVAEHALAEGSDRVVEALTGWGLRGGDRGRILRIREVELGSVSLPSVVADVPLVAPPSKSTSAGRVGGRLLERFKVTLDLPHLRLYLEPNAAAESVEGWDRAGLWINRDGDGFRVEEVVPGSPAAEAGLRVGERIVSVDGRSARGLSLSEVRRSWRTLAAGTVVRLEVERDGAARAVELTLRDLV